MSIHDEVLQFFSSLLHPDISQQLEAYHVPWQACLTSCACPSCCLAYMSDLREALTLDDSSACTAMLC